METIETQNVKIEQKKIFINGNNLRTSDIVFVIKNNLKIAITEATEHQIEKSHQLLTQLIDDNKIIYGVNTSVGGFVNWLIPKEKAQELQENLISAVATNVGPYFDTNVVKASMIARLNSLARGASGISVENYNKLLDIYNAGIVPCVPSKGSLGASGDLGPLACIALVGTGKWKAEYKGKILSGKEALDKAGIKPMRLSYKEGLSLVNGTSTMVGLASLLVEEAINLVKTYDIISCLTFESLMVKKKPFSPVVHKHKPHPGQLTTSKNFWRILEDSKMIVDEAAVEKELQKQQNPIPTSSNFSIEDAYSIRCTPHILGPIRDSLKSIQLTIENELNSSNDNPLILPEENDVFHNGHFHGQYISMAMDHLSIALTTLSNLSDRRIDRFMDTKHSNNLPPFLCLENPGLRLGLMGGQFMATSLTAENRSLCHPVSIQTLTSTGDFQDIVSLGLVAARRARDILTNANYVVAFEYICGAQAAEIRDKDLLSQGTRKAFDQIREIIPYLSSDEPLTDYIENVASYINSGSLLHEVEKVIGQVDL